MLLISIALASIILSLLMLLVLSKLTTTRSPATGAAERSPTTRWLFPVLGIGVLVLGGLAFEGFGNNPTTAGAPSLDAPAVVQNSPGSDAANNAGQSAATSASVSGVVTLSAELKERVSPEDTLFIVAKSPDGSGPPLAALRLKSAGFPIKFQLDDSAALMPGRSISQFKEVMVSAKISKGGSADASQDDILAAPVKARVGDSGLVIELNSQR